MGAIIFTANPLPPPLKKLKLDINVLIFGQILNIWATREGTNNWSQNRT